ncbi:Cytoplasmic dynein 2 heavy chain 1, partial [Kappamyces sp. JEL0680]
HYNEKMAAIEARAAVKLQALLSNLLQQPSQLLREFQRHKEIIKRKTIAQKLEGEKEVLLGQLMATLKTISAELTFRLAATSEAGDSCIANILWSRQTIGKLRETDGIVLSFIGSKTSYQSLSASLYEDVSKYEKDQFDAWVEDTQTQLDATDSQLTLEKSGRLMHLDFSTGKLNVNYGDKLVVLIRETRQLLSMGFAVPGFIQKLAENGQKFYKYGVVLKQIANFYNTIDQQMLPCQQAMLLPLALEFEKIVKSPVSDKNGAITWSNPQDLEAFVGKLQSAAERLTSENAKLRKYHFMVIDHVKTLMGVHLVTQQPRWKEIMGSIRGIINTALEGGIKPENALTWKNHIDHQLYKALEFQYQLGLESLSSSLSEMKVELIYKQQRIHFRPSLEEMRAKYFREMKKFINLPSSFKPLGDTSIFASMVHNNAKSLKSVYVKADQLFVNLSKVQDQFLEWIVLGTVDLDEFVENAVVDIAEWEQNFRMLKQKGKEAEQLPLLIQVDCISVLTAPIKAAIDDLLQRLFDALLNSLKKGANAHLHAVDQFTNMALAVLEQRPQTLAEIGSANLVHGELSKNKAQIAFHFEAAEQKN